VVSDSSAHPQIDQPDHSRSNLRACRGRQTTLTRRPTFLGTRARPFANAMEPSTLQPCISQRSCITEVNVVFIVLPLAERRCNLAILSGSTLVPKPLRPRSHVRVIAPSGPFDRALVLRGMAWLSERYRVTFGPDLFAKLGFLAGSDERRRGELIEALKDPTVEAIVTARGGHGLLRIAHSVPWGALLTTPKWLVGFSDPTVLHAEAWRIGVASLHAPNVAGLGRADAVGREAWISALEQPTKARVLQGLPGVDGRARGPLVGGNLTVLTMLAAAGRLWLPDGCILALEDVTETSYRIDRMLTVLAVGGYLDRVAGLAFGQFTDCGAGIFGVSAKSVVEERIGLRRPAVFELPFGHGRDNVPLLLGADAVLDGSTGELTVAAT